MNIIIEDEFARRVPGYRIIIVICNVANTPTSPAQKSEINTLAGEIARRFSIDDIRTLGPIAATRAAYKACGKDPNRYRPSQEQLMRRIVRGLGLYSVNSVVDAGNELSLRSRCAVGCFDARKIEGNVLTVGIGREGEPYEGIGRGPLNIAGLPVVRDAAGGIGTPTSDNVRTCIEPHTTRMLMTIHLFDPEIDAEHIVDMASEIFARHCNARDITHHIYK